MIQHDKEKVNATPASNQPQIQVSQKGAYVVIAAIAIILIIIIAAVASGVSKTSEDLKANANQTSQAAGLTAEEYAQKAEKAYLESWGYENFAQMAIDPDMPVGSNLRYITGFEGVSSDTFRVYVQKDLSDDEVKQVGINILGTLGLDMEDLFCVVVRDTGGKDVNVFRSSVPALR